MVVKKIDLSERIEDILTNLISIDSVTGNEKEITDVIESAIRKLNINFVSASRLNNTLVYDLNLSKEKTITLIGHVDTVPIEDNGNPNVNNGEVFGRGACDMKAGISCMLKVLYDLKEGNISPKYNLRFVFYEAEETDIGNVGMKQVISEGLLKETDFAFVLEPTDGRYGIGCLGSIMIKKEIKGNSSHSSTPWEGKNALYESIPLIQRIESIKPKKLLIDGISHYEVINITNISTSNADNVIPGTCLLTIDYRFSPLKKEARAKEELLMILGNEGIKSYYSVPSSLVKGVDEYLINDKERFIMQGWTDIASLNEAGIPAINFGPGKVEYAHRKDERISIKELREFYKSFVKHI